MSLLRLLTAGKSLVGVRDSESRYRLTPEGITESRRVVRGPHASAKLQSSNTSLQMEWRKRCGIELLLYWVARARQRRM